MSENKNFDTEPIGAFLIGFIFGIIATVIFIFVFL